MKKDDKINCAKKKEDFNSNFYNVEKQKLRNKVIFTYDVVFELSDVSMSSRWDHYLHSDENDSIHWINLINYFIIIVLISAIVVYVFLRSVKREIEIYNTVKNNNKNNENNFYFLTG